MAFKLTHTLRKLTLPFRITAQVGLNLKRLQDFLYRNFSKYEKYNDMLPSSKEDRWH